MLNKIRLKNEIVNSLKGENEIEKIIIFGSFNSNEFPNDLDIAVIQNSSDDYLTLSLKYRKLVRSISSQIAVDIFPVINKKTNSFFENEIESGEVIYERGN